LARRAFVFHFPRNVPPWRNAGYGAAVKNETPFTEIAKQLERAARNGTRAHLEPEQVRALIQSPAWPLLMAERMRELIATWKDE
jgi:hypothetical protein